MGAGPVELTEVGIYVYYAEDPATGRVEFEYDHVLRGEFLPGAPLLPDPDEVAELRWADPTALEAELELDPRSYAPWLGGVVNRLLTPCGPRVGRTRPGHDPARSSADDSAERSGGR